MLARLQSNNRWLEKLWTAGWGGLALYALFLSLPLSVYWPIGPDQYPDVLDIYSRPGFFLTDFAVLMVVAAALIARGRFLPDLGRPRFWRAWRETVPQWKSIFLPLVGLVVLAILTTPWALSPQLAVNTSMRWSLILILYYSISRLNPTMNALITVFLSGLGGHVLIGLLQVITRSPVGLPGELALAANRPGAAVLELAGSRWLRAYGLTFHPNVLGGLLAIGLLLGLPLLDRRRIRLLWWWCWLGLLITFSRSAWLAVGLVLPLVVAWLWWRIKKMRLSLSISLAGVGGILILGAVALKPQLTTRLNPGDSSLERISLQERGELIRLALASIRARPLVGVGAGNFPLAVLASGRPLTAHAVHNIPLLLATEIGVIGGLLWYWLWFAPSTRISQYVHASDPWPVVLYAAWFAFGIISLWDSYPWALNSGLLLSAALLGLIQPHLSANSASGGGTATARSKSNRR